jgi:hypothetical protein
MKKNKKDEYDQSTSYAHMKILKWNPSLYITHVS